MRDIRLVIEQILEIIPEARNDLKQISDSAPYAAPEAIGGLWRRLCNVLSSIASNHPRREEIQLLLEIKFHD